MLGVDGSCDSIGGRAATVSELNPNVTTKRPGRSLPESIVP